MADRRRQVVMLLETRYDHLWLPAGSLRTRPGLAPGDRRPCVTCGGVELRDDFGKTLVRRRGRGFVRTGRKDRSRCPSCGGDGWVARDSMDSTRARLGSETTSASARPRRTVTCDRCAGEGVWHGQRCELCDGRGTRDLHRFELHLDTATPDDERDPVAEAIDRRDQTGSYHELDLALDGVLHHVNKPPPHHALRGRHAITARRLLDLIHLPPAELTYGELEPFDRLLATMALAYIDSRMPDPIRVPADVRHAYRAREERLRRIRGRGTDRRALEQRNRQARQWAREGRPLPWICAELGLSDRQLRRVLNGDQEAA